MLFLIGPDLQRVENIGNSKVCPEKQLYIFLMYLGTKMTYRYNINFGLLLLINLNKNLIFRSIANLFGVGKSTVWEIVFRCVAALIRYRNYFIRWPTRREAEEISNSFQQRTGFRKVLGLLDGTHVEIPKQSEYPESYMNRKKYSSIQTQV